MVTETITMKHNTTVLSKPPINLSICSNKYIKNKENTKILHLYVHFNLHSMNRACQLHYCTEMFLLLDKQYTNHAIACS
jgi:hypothetical protein